MTIGEMIEDFCKHTGMTNQKFAEKCGVSKGYISQLINGRNPKTGKPITPTIETYIKMAQTMNISLDDLFWQLDDAPIALKTSASSWSKEWSGLSDSLGQTDDDGSTIPSSIEYALAGELRNMSEAGKMDVLQFARFIREKESKEREAHDD